MVRHNYYRQALMGVILLAFFGLAACGGGSDGELQNVPVFTSPSNVAATENNTETGYTASAADADLDPLTFSLTGGADQKAFEIDKTTGVLSFVTAPDFETPADSDADNVYVVEISVSDGTYTVTQTVTITVNNVFDVSVSSAGIKIIRFDWSAFGGSTNYKLFVNPDGASGYSLLQDNLTGTSTTIGHQHYHRSPCPFHRLGQRQLYSRSPRQFRIYN
jgi:hypothetical protein